MGVLPRPQGSKGCGARPHPRRDATWLRSGNPRQVTDVGEDPSGTGRARAEQLPSGGSPRHTAVPGGTACQMRATTEPVGSRCHESDPTSTSAPAWPGLRRRRDRQVAAGSTARADERASWSRQCGLYLTPWCWQKAVAQAVLPG